MSAYRVGRVQIPIFQIILAIPHAIRAAHEVARDDRDADSDGGEAVTAKEVAEAIGVFVAELGKAIAPALIEANVKEIKK